MAWRFLPMAATWRMRLPMARCGSGSAADRDEVGKKARQVSAQTGGPTAVFQFARTRLPRERVMLSRTLRTALVNLLCRSGHLHQDHSDEDGGNGHPAG